MFFLILGAFAGGFVNGLAGFGTSLFALGWWLQVMPPLQAVAVVLAMSVASSVQGVVYVRKSIRLSRISLFLLPALAGIPIGLSILEHINADQLKLVIAGFLIIYGGFFAFRRDLPSWTRPTPVVDATVGFVSGILGAIAGLSGALPTMWLAMRAWSKEETRAVLQPFNMVVLGISALLLSFKGAYDQQTIIIAFVAMGLAIVAAQAGIMTFKRLDDRTFRRLLIILMLISGLALLGRQLSE